MIIRCGAVWRPGWIFSGRRNNGRSVSGAGFQRRWPDSGWWVLAPWRLHPPYKETAWIIVRSTPPKRSPLNLPPGKMLLANAFAFFLPPCSPPFVKGGSGGISDVGAPARKKIPPNPPLRKGGTSAECTVSAIRQQHLVGWVQAPGRQNPPSGNEAALGGHSIHPDEDAQRWWLLPGWWVSPLKGLTHPTRSTVYRWSSPPGPGTV